MKTKEELNALKEEVETLNKKLAELTEEELTQVTGGSDPVILGKLDVGATHLTHAPELPATKLAE